MFGYIILRDIPKNAAQLDLTIYDIQGGFRGFALVPPGAHYVSVKVNGCMSEGFWCYLKPSSVIIKVYDHETDKFMDPDRESKARYESMALSGVMNRALIPVMKKNAEMSMLWQSITSCIQEKNYPLTLNSETPMNTPLELTPEELSEWYLKTHKSRFEQAYFDTHEGNSETLLAEFQYAFALFTVRKVDERAFDRWSHLLQAFYNAGERSIKSAPDIFTRLSKIIIE